MDGLRFRPDIEGLRGVAILLVVAYHVGVPGFAGGFVGVDVFFALSGYLITQLLVRELEDHGRVHLAGFYARRMRRLLPAAAVAIAVTLALAALVQPPSTVMETATEAAAAAASMSNLLFASQAMDYFREAGPSPLLHTWSLSVEEQFYLVWPLLVLMAAGRRADRQRLGAVLVLVVLTSAAMCWWWTIAQRPVAFYGMPYRAWEFALGGLAGLIRVDRGGAGRARHAAAALIAIGLASIGYATAAYTERTPFPGLHAALPVLGTCAVLIAAGRHGSMPLARVLAAQPLQWLGRHSYGWYLWHWPLLTLGVAVMPDAALPARAALAVAALGVAMASLRHVEEPVRRGIRFQVRPARVFMAGAAVVAGIALLALGLRTAGAAALADPSQAAFAAARVDFHQCRHADVATAQVEVCRLGADAPERTLVLFGDSHAGHWAPALEAVAAAHRWEVLVIAKGSCPSVQVTLREPFLNREYHECETWRRAALDTIRTRRPALVLLSNASEYVNGGPFTSARTGTSLAEWEAGLGATIEAIIASGSGVGVIAHTPRAPENLPACLTLAAWRGRDTSGCDFAVAGAVHPGVADAERRVAARFGAVRLVDLTEALCGGGRCRAWDGSLVLYRDTNHLTSAAGRALAPALLAALRGGPRGL